MNKSLRKLKMDLGKDLDGWPAIGDWIVIRDGVLTHQIGGNIGKYSADEYSNGYMCKKCFLKRKFHGCKFIECNFCSKKFLYHNWANNCASGVNDAHISSGYGSRYDFNVYMWKSRLRPDKYKHCKTICDSCIDTLVDEKIIYLFSNEILGF